MPYQPPALTEPLFTKLTPVTLFVIAMFTGTLTDPVVLIVVVPADNAQVPVMAVVMGFDEQSCCAHA